MKGTWIIVYAGMIFFPFIWSFKYSMLDSEVKQHVFSFDKYPGFLTVKLFCCKRERIGDFNFFNSSYFICNMSVFYKTCSDHQ